MKKFLSLLIISLSFMQVSYAFECPDFFKLRINKDDTQAVKSVLNSQVKYANRANFNKFIKTYDKDYKNYDGFNLEQYSALVKDIWETYDNIKYGIKIQDIEIKDDTAIARLVETSYADIPLTKDMDGVLKSTANSIYYLKKFNGKWKVTSDEVIDETTSMMYGDAIGLNIDLAAPPIVKPGEEYTASLSFEPPKGTMAIASIAKDVVEYPQKQPQEVFRKLPEDNILERLFIANKNNLNEYIVASIGITRADVSDLSIKISLAGFGYQIIRVNVAKPEETNVKDK